MKLLITGGTGFIGSRLALKSVELGHTVIVLGQINNEAESRNRAELERAGVTLVLGSVIEPDKIGAAIKGCEVVFHLAAAQHEANVPDQHFWDVNVTGTENLLEAAVNAGVKRFVHGSTIGVYGAAMEGELDEESALLPDNIYGRTKLEAEKRVLSYAERLPVVIVRISETYGPGDRRLLKLFRAIASNLFFVIGKGNNQHQLIYVDDLISGLLATAQEARSVGEIFTIAGSEILTTCQMVENIAASLGVKPKKWRAPLWPFMAAAVIAEKTLGPLGIQPPIHRRRMDFFRKSFYFSQRKTHELLGFQPKVSFVDGVKATADWYKTNGYL